MRRAVLLLALLLALAVPAWGTELGDAFDLDAVAAAAPAEAEEVLGDADPGSADLEGGLERLWTSLQARFPAALREIARPLAAILAVTLTCSMAESFAPGGPAGEAVQMAGCLAVAAIGAEDVKSVLALGTGTLERLGEFSRVLLPTLTAAAAAGGAPGSAAAVWAASALFSDLLLTAANGLVLPLLTGFVAVSCACAVLGDRRLAGPVQLLQWGTRTLLKGLALAFTAYLGLSRILGAASDAAAVKTARALLSSGVPVIGRVLSDASEALVAGAGLLRTSIGLYGLVAVLAALLLPLLRLALRVGLFRAAAAVCTAVAGERVGRLLDRFGSAYALLLGLVSTAAAIELLAIISLIRTVTP